MADVIKLMSDALANQIAAGEVIQRPASVIKELVENSVDAGATEITINVKDAGRTLIQVIDNGCGMSVTDAKMCFERHATSKIYKSDDLFCIYTKGFRGEALPSIAAVAEVELKTRREDDNIGTQVIINGSQFISQNPINTPVGTNFAIKSLFFNVPARRKFLKSNSTELQHIVNEFQRIVLTHPNIEFTLYHNDNLIYNLRASNLKQRIVNVFGKSINQELIPVEIDTSIVKITGFTGKPSATKRRSDKQFFFVNNRYMKSQYFHKAITLAYENIVRPDCIPPYFLYFDIDPHTIDVNVHPTKTEINFENTSDIFRLLQAGIRETLSKCDIAPAIDFEGEPDAEIPHFSKNDPIPPMPKVSYNPYYNPFDNDSEKNNNSSYHSNYNETSQHNLNNWQNLYSNFDNDSDIIMSSRFNSEQQSELTKNDSKPLFSESVENRLIQIKNKYIVSPSKSGLMIIDQHRAHKRILYEKYLDQINANVDAVQTLLYPIELPLDVQNFAMAYDIRDEFQVVGFDIEFNENNSLTINGIPSFLNQNNAIDIINDIIESYKEGHGNVSSSIKDILAIAAANREVISYGQTLLPEEMRNLIDSLFSTSAPNYSPEGNPTIIIIGLDELEKKFS
ncbi:MAG: DNA mismatch repair endonuclease MutL [Bacteroidales bacterium]|nr:DNA mismatch repair endonuclease MutL [Bacteroidales bacterium]